MASNSSYETSWADQWDPEPQYSYPAAHTNSSNTSSSKFSDKTKAAASTGVRKVKMGATAGFHWIKNKYQKTTNKN
ncbi:hypothetical protein C2S52_020618 [Perilla frutescens var. hirtella]|uniref:Uncharacterized protein n=1 Tax=Perilla frutescens var. hirtella TaxID=608512 RepID=A0AAD4IVP8_PERFH|nr:hypothetical protein C2S52_020618 [Perilla frutescens var. hirtella]KAH6822374.1 hypothetical protein C2S53_003839 [Perilla frutescens var. hirtella]